MAPIGQITRSLNRVALNALSAVVLVVMVACGILGMYLAGHGSTVSRLVNDGVTWSGMVLAVIGGMMGSMAVIRLTKDS